jgi:exonuclease SbcD
MRLIHTSDWHLGHELHGFDRGFEHDAFLDWLARQIVEREADVLLVTGDVYDTVNPSVPAQQRLYRFLNRTLAENPGLQVVLLGGNHDSLARLELPRDLLDRERVHLAGSLAREAGRPAPERALLELRDRRGRAGAICAVVPYLRPGDLPPAAEGETPVRTLYRRIGEAAEARRGGLPLILTGHLHLHGGSMSELSERRIILGGEEAIPADIFPTSAVYVALGHLHRPQQLAGSGTIRYAGSPFPLSVTERNYRHGIVVLDLGGGSRIGLDEVEAPRVVPFLRVPAVGAASLGEVEAMLEALEIDDPGEPRRPFLEVAVRLDGPEPSLRQRIDRALLGKPVRLTRIVRQFADEADGTADRVGPGEASLGEIDPVEVFARRHREAYGTAPSEDLVKAFKEVLAEALSPAGEETMAA